MPLSPKCIWWMLGSALRLGTLGEPNKAGRRWLSDPGHQECNMKAYEFPCKVTPEGETRTP